MKISLDHNQNISKVNFLYLVLLALVVFKLIDQIIDINLHNNFCKNLTLHVNIHTDT